MERLSGIMQSGNRKASERTIGKILEDKANKNGGKPFLYFKDEIVSYEQVNERANRIANGFLNMGFKKEDKAALLLDNCLEFLYVWFGLVKVGVIAVPISPAHKGTILQHMLNNSDAQILVADKNYVENIRSIIDNLPCLTTLIVYPDKNEVQIQRLNLVSYPELLKNPSTTPKADAKNYDIAGMLFTSGTTGVSKGVMLSHECYIWSGEETIKETCFTSDDVWFLNTPLFHQIALGMGLMVALLSDGALALVERFSVRAFWDEVKKYNATVWCGVGTLLEFIYNQPPRLDDANNSLRHVISPAIRQGLQKPFEERFKLIVTNDYGMTEVNPVAYPLTMDRKPGFGVCGKSPEDLEVRIFNDNDKELLPNETGEVVVRPKRPYIMMQGYYKMPEETVKVWRNLWFHTGDLAYKDEEGNLHFVERKKDVIRRRGENISSRELESIVNSHPSISESAAVGVPSEVGEEDVKVVVRLKKGNALSAEDLIDFCKERMAFFMIPRYIEFVDSFPVTSTGRIQKTELRAITSSTWDRGKEDYKLKKK